MTNQRIIRLGFGVLLGSFLTAAHFMLREPVPPTVNHPAQNALPEGVKVVGRNAAGQPIYGPESSPEPPAQPETQPFEGNHTGWSDSHPTLKKLDPHQPVVTIPHALVCPTEDANTKFAELMDLFYKPDNEKEEALGCREIDGGLKVEVITNVGPFLLVGIDNEVMPVITDCEYLMNPYSSETR